MRFTASSVHLDSIGEEAEIDDRGLLPLLRQLVQMRQISEISALTDKNHFVNAVLPKLQIESILFRPIDLLR
jgi:hypothetical protein